MAQRSEYTVRVHDEDGSLWAEVLELPGCFAAGDTIEELRAAAVEAITLYVGGEVGGFEWGPATERIEDHHILLNA